MHREQLQSGLQRALSFLTTSQGKDGGWGYAVGRQSYAEPTCYSLLALAATGVNEPSDWQPQALSWLTAHTNQAGALTVTSQSNSSSDLNTFDNWGTLLAFFTLQKLSSQSELRERYLKYLLNSRGNALDKRVGQDLKLNPDLQAWSWARSTASWVEPTAYALLGLKANGMRDHERVKTGEAFLFDRACYEGGWNYGNKEVLSVILEPMPTNTCFALLALQDVDRQHEVITKSVAYLEKELLERQSALLLALGSLCLNIYERPTEPWLTALQARQQDNGSWRDNVHVTALGALALQCGMSQRNIFKL
ncbi:MAG TPA: hypothetical protein VFZ34_06370 [Blastocatellia bacterium]|nr:hypothetical protein [Blastocatellia bacterium]